MKDVLELGRHLTKELGVDASDTLGRWMAHHIAELIDAAENRPEGKTKSAAARAILDLWDHRASLPGASNPLARYRAVLVVLHRLRPEIARPSFRWFGSGPLSGRGRAPAIFDDFARLIMALLFLEGPYERKKPEPAAVRALSKEEQETLAHLDYWVALFDGREKTKKKKGAVKKEVLDHDALLRAIEDLIKSVMGNLTALRKELANSLTKSS